MFATATRSSAVKALYENVLKEAERSVSFLVIFLHTLWSIN